MRSNIWNLFKSWMVYCVRAPAYVAVEGNKDFENWPYARLCSMSSTDYSEI